MLDVVATALGPLAEQVVFVGGSVVGLLLDDPGSVLIRATLDVDLVVEAVSNTDYYEFGSELKKRGFAEDTRERAPLCRWVVAGTTVDIMPSDARPLGFTNPWYALVLKTSRPSRGGGRSNFCMLKRISWPHTCPHFEVGLVFEK